MESLTNAEAAGAAKLRPIDRVTWVRGGLRVLRRPGGRWRPALTAREIVRADAQKADYLSAAGGAT
jgi:hypothetical protein